MKRNGTNSILGAPGQYRPRLACGSRPGSLVTVLEQAGVINCAVAVATNHEFGAAQLKMKILNQLVQIIIRQILALGFLLVAPLIYLIPFIFVVLSPNSDIVDMLAIGMMVTGPFVSGFLDHDGLDVSKVPANDRRWLPLRVQPGRHLGGNRMDAARLLRDTRSRIAFLFHRTMACRRS